ncbi:porin [Massilia eurypsychrophila]|uniref:Porin n=1 Tax=Massilia eurypsychrophila TaxID=1485217 RepID=A0A2G8TBQ1_9BURK|nr:porin [Massilia eurypsychrophila]PIL43487.1 porin [Massilia eurypsychrophila]
MKKVVLAATLALIGGATASSAVAQSQVTIYGVVDSGLVYTTNTNAAGDSMVKMPGLTGSAPSRLGFRGTEDLGNGLQAIFVLEGGLNLDTGTMGQGNRLFGRQANVGLKGEFGTLTLGRQINMTFLSALKSDVMGPNLFSMSSIDLYIPNARSDNAIGYLGNFSAFTVGATYSLGRDASAAGGPSATNCAGEVAGNSKACRQVTALLGYDNKAWGVTTSYDIMYGNTGAAGGLTTSESRDRRTTLNGYAMVGATKIGAGAMARRKVAATPVNDLKTDLYYIGASHPLTPALQLDGQVARHDVDGSANDSTLSVLRLTYSLSKRTAVYSSLGHMKNGGSAAIALDVGGTVGAGMNQSGLSAGLRHSF